MINPKQSSDYFESKAHSQVCENFRQLKVFKSNEKCFLTLKSLLVLKISKYLTFLSCTKTT